LVFSPRIFANCSAPIECVPFDECDRVHKAAKAKTDAEQLQMANIAAGTNDRSWVDAALKRLNCEIVE
jgi:hypothetical protein